MIAIVRRRRKEARLVASSFYGAPHRRSAKSAVVAVTFSFYAQAAGAHSQLRQFASADTCTGATQWRTRESGSHPPKSTDTAGEGEWRGTSDPARGRRGRRQWAPSRRGAHSRRHWPPRGSSFVRAAAVPAPSSPWLPHAAAAAALPSCCKETLTQVGQPHRFARHLEPISH